MSVRGTLISLAVNFIVAGSVWYIKGPNAGLFCLGIGFVLLVFAWLWPKKPKSPTPPPPTTQRNEQRVEANPNINVQIGGELFGQKKEQQPPPKQEQPPSPLLEVIEDKDIVMGYNGGEWYEAESSFLDILDNKLNAHIIVFRKQPAPPGKSSPPLSSVTAHLTFRGKDGSQLVIDFGAWLREYTHFVDFLRAESHALILSTGVRASGRVDKNVYALDNPHRTDPRKGRIHAGVTVIGAPTEKALMDDCSEVDIVLVAGQTTVYRDTFTFSLDPEGTMREFRPAS